MTGLVALGLAWLVRDAAAVRVWPHLVLGFMFLGSVAMWLSDPSEFRRDNRAVALLSRRRGSGNP